MEDSLNLNFLMKDDLKKILQPKTIKNKNNNICKNGREPEICFKRKRPTFF
jgi:hypothetical protein